MPSTTPTTVAIQPLDQIEEPMTAAVYEDGVYEATGAYTSPAGAEEVEISITLEDGVVSDATFTGKATNTASIRLQKSFAEGFEEQVVGKPIDEISLTVVNGSSLTPQGFMDALEQIKSEATQS